MFGRRGFLILLMWFFIVPAAVGQERMEMDSLLSELAQSKEDSGKVRLLLTIGDSYRKTNLVQTLSYLTKARTLANKLSLKELEALSDRWIGNAYLAMGEFNMAATAYFNARINYEAVNDDYGVFTMHNNLGIIYDRLENYDKALEEYFKAQQIYLQIPQEQRNESNLPYLYNNIGNIYQIKSDTASALEYYQKALSLGREFQDHRILGIVYNNLGKIYLMDMNQPDKGFDYFLAGLKEREIAGDIAEIAKSKLMLGDYYLQQSMLQEAKTYALDAITLSKEIGSLETQQYSYKCLSEIEQALGNYNEALTAFQTFKLLSDSIMNQKTNSEMTRLQLQYEFDKAEETRENELTQSRLRYRSTIALLTLGLLVVGLILVVIRNRSKRMELSRQNLQQDVESKNKQLTTNVMYLIRKNELINKVAERLLSIKKDVGSENSREIQSIILELQREADNDSWQEFELRFNQVHTEFYDRLRKMFPDLTPADEKLCAFLRLNMNTKEIAAITQQSVKSVEVARSRLRKKLNLTNTSANLVSFLSTL